MLKLKTGSESGYKFNSPQMLTMDSEKAEEMNRNGIEDPAKQWDRGIIPYDISHLRREGS